MMRGSSLQRRGSTHRSAALLLQMLGRNPPDLERVARELEHLISGKSTTPSRETLAAETAPASDSLDMT